MHIKQAQLAERPRDKSLTPVNWVRVPHMQTLKHTRGAIAPFDRFLLFFFGSNLVQP